MEELWPQWRISARGRRRARQRARWPLRRTESGARVRVRGSLGSRAWATTADPSAPRATASIAVSRSTASPQRAPWGARGRGRGRGIRFTRRDACPGDGSRVRTRPTSATRHSYRAPFVSQVAKLTSSGRHAMDVTCVAARTLSAQAPPVSRARRTAHLGGVSAELARKLGPPGGEEVEEKDALLGSSCQVAATPGDGEALQVANGQVIHHVHLGVEQVPDAYAH